MENEKLTYINSRGERLELGVDSVYHCNISKDVEGISGVTSVIYSTNSMGQHGDTYVGQRIEARDIDVVGHINTRDKAQALELRRRMLKIFNPDSTFMQLAIGDNMFRYDAASGVNSLEVSIFYSKEFLGV